MKNIKTKRYLKYYLSALIISVSFLGCNDYLDVDTDTDNPTSAPLNQLLPNIEITVAGLADFNFFSGDMLSVYTHQTVAREEQDQYGTTAANVLLNNDWNNVYLALTDMETLISQADESGDRVYKGITQILKAYMMSVAVDMWGDVPFTEATLLKEGTVSPIFDNGEAIYQSVLDLLAEGKSNVNSGEGLVPGIDDFFYGGSAAQWNKFANSFKLKLYNQIRLSSLFNQSDFNALVAENNFFTSNADDFQFNHTATIAPLDERNQLFRGAYGGAQVTYYVSPWFYEILKGMNPNIHNGIEDPRIPYYWANQLVPGQFPRDQGDASTGDPHADYWDSSTGFFTIRFGSIGPDRDHAVQTDATFPGIFPCGGHYDDGQGFARTIASGTGLAPRRMFTYDEFLYVQAELIQVGLLAGDSASKLNDAMIASFAKVDQVVAGTGTTQTVPVLSGSANVVSFIANINSEYAAASPAKQLEIIMTQKWVATFGDPMDQFNDFRRTGYPILADPLGPSPEYQLDNEDAWPLTDSETVLNNNFQHTFFWPQNELNLNQNAPAQKDPTAFKVFWDN
ncbi:MAG: SusD/RagB family nutrient-binding outer membrane lipoprotein [Bacteroidetes bacterium]|nr:MAG: SusD/RagB family nutrient-binding outer membrane lipoprotein [Bacteroidota bacterium]